MATARKPEFRLKSGMPRAERWIKQIALTLETLKTNAWELHFVVITSRVGTLDSKSHVPAAYRVIIVCLPDSEFT
jgi:hypothetical protein